MRIHVRTALGLACLLALLSARAVWAKGGYAFLTVTGADLDGELRLSDPALTEDFFAFADFYHAAAEAPIDPGPGYEITRYYVQANSATVFDRLHYYPDSGYVFYNGIWNGSSEYDGKWYRARPEMKDRFTVALTTAQRLVSLGTPEGSRTMVPPAEAGAAVRSMRQPSSVIGLVAATALLLALVRRRFWPGQARGRVWRLQ